MGAGNAERIVPPDPSATPRSRSIIGEARGRARIADGLFELDQLEVAYDVDHATLWTMMNPAGRASFNRQLLTDFEAWQDLIIDSFGGDDAPPLLYLVLGSRVSGVFCYGGDLDLFVRLIRAGDRAGLVDYGRRCVNILHRNIASLDLPIVTIGLVQGDALGGGWEALMSFDVIVAERGSKFGLPETMFGLFPGMGAHAILGRKLGYAKAEHIILSGETLTAEDLYDMGLVHILAQPGEGRAEVERYIGREARRQGGRAGAFAAMKRVNPVTIEELCDIVEIWADSALRLAEKDIRLMLRLVAAQTRHAPDQATLEPSPFSAASKRSA
ncbi:MAG: crotonase/enoyl-CoA hydratase family protein [Sphingomonadales bacterium]|nr:crotonase/enoyl-CoA hydratase family protein [Sphingomonadales bacterium]